MSKHKIPSFNELLKKELGFLLLKEIEFPPKTFVTIIHAVTSPDLQHAKVYISVIPEDKTKEVLLALSRNIFELQQHLNSRLRMRPIPKIEWELNTNTEQVQKVEELLEEIKKKK